MHLKVIFVFVLSCSIIHACAGHGQYRILNGVEALEMEFPYQASISISTDDDRVSVCGGSIIGHKWVLTAGHCVQGLRNAKITIGLGSIDRTTPDQQRVVNPRRVVIHPKYNGKTSSNDIALIAIPKVGFTRSIKPIKLPALSERSDFSGENGVISGWGQIGNDLSADDYLQHAIVPIINNNECSKQVPVERTQLCTISDESGFCFGDSGGPLVLESKPIQVGIVSFVFDGCESGLPNLFTRVTSYLQWIKDNTGIPY